MSPADADKDDNGADDGGEDDDEVMVFGSSRDGGASVSADMIFVLCFVMCSPALVCLCVRVYV